MKIGKCNIDNFAAFQSFTCDFGKVTYICGVNGSGKTTLTQTALQAAMFGVGEKSSNGNLVVDRAAFIGPHRKSADVMYELVEENGNVITCRNHITKSSNEIKYDSADKRVITLDWIRQHFNINLMSAKHFAALSGQQQAVTCGIDCKAIDAEIKALKDEYTLINRDIKAFGLLEEVESVQPIDLQELYAKKEEIKISNRDMVQIIKDENERRRIEYRQLFEKEQTEIAAFNELQDVNSKRLSDAKDCLADLWILGYVGKEVEKFIATLPKGEEKKVLELKEPEYQDEVLSSDNLDEIDNQIAYAIETNDQAKGYDEWFKKNQQFEGLKKKLEDNQTEQQAKAAKRLEYIKSVDFGIEGLDVDEAGSLTLNGRPVREPYFSRGEMEMAVAKITSKVCPNWKTRFLDNFESLDEDNQKKIIGELTAAGYHVIAIEVAKSSDKDGALILRECKEATGLEGY